MSISLIVASAEPHFREFVREHLAHTPGAKLVAEHEEVGLNVYVRILHDLERHPNAAVLLDIGADPEQGLRALEHMTNSLPGVYVIVSEYQGTSEFLIRGLRAGAADYLQQPLKRPEFRDAMTRLEQHVSRAHQQGKPLGKLYTFLGVKGGLGTTTAAINFAAVCAKQQKNTIVVDLDLDSGDVASFLGLHPQYSIYDVVENLDRLDQAMLEGIATRDALGFSVLTPPDDLEKARMVRGDHLKEIATFLVEKYDAVIVDGSRGLDETLLGCLELSESVFLVLTQEFLAVRNAQQYLGALGKLGFNPEQLKIVVNRYGKGQNSAVSMEQIQQTLGAKVFYAIPNRYTESLQAVHQSRPAVIYPGDLQQAYLGMSRKILANGTAGAAKAAESAAPERKKFLGII
jgi:pilus assembly protein CpaE